VARSVRRGGHVIVSSFGPEDQPGAAGWTWSGTMRPRCTRSSGRVFA
jgi:hypothetical protein